MPQNTVQAAYRALAGHYVVFAQSLDELGDLRFAATLGQKVSAYGTLIDQPYLAHIDLSALAVVSALTLSMIFSPPKGASYLFFDSLAGVLSAQCFPPGGTLDRSLRIVGLTYLISGEFHVYPVQKLIVTAVP